MRKKYRSPAQRNTLRPQLLAWRSRVHKAAGFGNIVQVEVFLPDTVINSLVKVAPKASESIVHEALLCLDLEKEWLKEVFGIIHAFDHGGWEALHTATTTASTLSYISQQSHLRMESQATASSSQETEYRSGTRSSSPSSSSQMSDLYLDDIEPPSAPITVSTDLAATLSATAVIPGPCTSQKRTLDKKQPIPSTYARKRPKSEANKASVQPDGDNGSQGMMTRLRTMRQLD